MTTLEERVFQALDNALANDYFMFLVNSPIIVAEDLCEYDADLENEHPQNLVRHVEAWFDSRKQLQYFYDDKRHLVCLPYSRNNLRAMARDLGIGMSWFHGGRRPHFDVPKTLDVSDRAKLVSQREVLAIIRDGQAPA